ncbi:MAG: hypothetical protein AAF039_16295 [Bacteroidota bacterium]
MKITKMLVASALLIGAMASAQREGYGAQRGALHQDLTAEQLATLKTKKMTLALDLNEKQQEAIFEFNVANAEFRKEKMEERKAQKERGERSRPTSEERYSMANAQLDRMIAQQKELKKILNDEQFDQWKKMQTYKHAHHKRSRQKEGRKGK